MTVVALVLANPLREEEARPVAARVAIKATLGAFPR